MIKKKKFCGALTVGGLTKVGELGKIFFELGIIELPGFSNKTNNKKIFDSKKTQELNSKLL
jgi:hypothetical protein